MSVVGIFAIPWVAFQFFLGYCIFIQMDMNVIVVHFEKILRKLATLEAR